MTEPVLSTVLVVCRECFPYHDANSLPHIVRLLNDYLDTFSTQWTVADACGSGLSKRALDYLAVRDPEWTNGKFAVHHAVTKGYVHVLQWLNDYYPEQALWRRKVSWRIWTVTCLMELAVRARQLPVLQWLHANRTEKCTPEAMDEAAKIGRLDIIQWLYENRTEGCTTNALVNAAENGNIEIEKWLHYHYPEKCTKNVMDFAAGFGNLEIVEWLHTNCSEGCTTKAMDLAARSGHLEVVRFLHENRSEDV